MKLAKEGVYTFLVEKNARKNLIAQVVEDQFGVDVISVKTANFKGEIRMQRMKRAYYNVPGFKKALVRVKKGQKIGLFETETSEEKEEVKEKKSLLKGTKVKIERDNNKTKIKNEEVVMRGGEKE